MEKKYLRWIGITAAVLTCLMIVYTVIATLTAGKEQVGTATQQPPAEQVSSQPRADNSECDEKLFPKELAGMTRAEVVTGQKAIDSVSQMHGTNIQVVNAEVVTYQGPGKEQILIWIADSKDEQDGKALFNAMDAKMPKTQYFQNYKTVSIGGKEYKSVTSQDGMQHYYWLKGNRNIWVGISAPNPADILKQVAPLY